MRICNHCGSEIPDGELFCPKCLTEVQLVPNYETMESRMQMEQMRQEEQRQMEEEFQRASLRAEMERKRQKKKKRVILISTLLSLLLIVLLAFFIGKMKASSSFQFQYERAEKAFEKKDYASALEYAKKAVSLNPKSAEAGTLLGQIYEASGDTQSAAKQYRSVLKDNINYEKAYDLSLPLFTKLEMYDQVKEVLAACKSEKLLKKYADYNVSDIQFSVKSGSYDAEQNLVLSSNGNGTIYYTTDSKNPDENAMKYTQAIELKEGRTEIRAVYISPKGVHGEVAKASYSVSVSLPPAPIITPSSGTYTSSDVLKITVEVPSGYTAYYAFDQKPTAKSKQYTEPVEMPQGSHVFYAVLVNNSQKTGPSASATYVFTKKASASPTPAASLNPNETRSPVTVTPTPTVKATVTPTPTASPSGDEEEEEEWSYEP